ncbi:hypothetical protein V6N13_147009 [Hibiscus sabdariffa]
MISYTVKDYRDMLVDSIFLMEKDPPYFSCSAAYDASPLRGLYMSLSCKEKGTFQALESMLFEVARVQLHGFSEREVSVVQISNVEKKGIIPKEEEYVPEEIVNVKPAPGPSVLMEMLAGKRIEVGTKFGAYLRTFSGHCSTSDLGTALQLVYQLFKTNAIPGEEDVKLVVEMA